MFQRLLSMFGMGANTTSITERSRRKHVRHPGFNAKVVINESSYDVHDWSMGGVSFEPIVGVGINIGDKVKVELQFSVGGTIVTIAQDAKLVRSNYSSAAAEFEPLPGKVKSEFEGVLEMLYTQSFVDSQIFS